MRITSSQDRLNILLAEDSKGDAILIAKALQRALPEAHNLTTVPTLIAAVKALGEKPFDVGLLDRSLPDVDGFNGLHSLQNMSPQLPIIFLTAYKDEQIAFEAIEQGAQDYLFKDTIDAHIIKRSIQYAILRKQFEGVLIMRANFDLLTGLANRTLFENRLDMALVRMKRMGGSLAVLFLDLDRFKQVNDTYGHAAGDKLLKEIATRLKTVLRPYDTIARFGGDEFALLLEGMSQPQSEIVAKKLIQTLEAPVMLSNQIVKVGISIGIAICAENQPLSRDTMMQRADEAMYVAKSFPQSCYHVFTAYAAQASYA